MKAREIRDLDHPVLLEKIEAKREELFRLRLAWAANTLEDQTQVKAARKELARMLTIAHERELAHAYIGQEAPAEAQEEESNAE